MRIFPTMKIWLFFINKSQENNVILNGPKIGLVSTMQIIIQSYLDFGVKYDQDVSSWGSQEKQMFRTSGVSSNIYTTTL